MAFNHTMWKQKPCVLVVY